MLYKKSFLASLLIVILLSLPSAVYAASNFALKDTAGKKHTLSQYKGKWVPALFRRSARFGGFVR
jgi:cytochrome oxidase Cu insertion factor (SCO1/SenC/PrrC family)